MIKLALWIINPCFVDGALEMTLFTGNEGTKQMTFRVIAENLRILHQGRQAGEGEVTAKI